MAVWPGFFKRTGRWLFLAIPLFLCLGATAQATETLTLGVFAYRPKPILQQSYQPLADYLSTQLQGAKVELRVLDMEEFEPALVAGEIDLLFTNPSHYTVLRNRNSLTGALATLISIKDGQPTCNLGGVIITRREGSAVNTITDLRRRRLAVPGTKFLGGYQTQAFELLQAGLRLPEDATVFVVKSHDAVVQKVLAGEVDAGFIRTGIIEQLTAEGTLDPTRLRVIHPQTFPDFPYQVSTRLYPEWPFVALPQVDSRHVRKIAAALLGLEATHPVAMAAGIGGFSPPADYAPVDELARALRLPPYDQAPAFTWRDIWERYEILIVVIVTFLVVTALLLVLIVRSNRALALAYRKQELERKKAQNYLDTVQTLMLALDDQGRITMINRFGCELLGYSESDLMGQPWFSTCLPQPDGMARVYPFFKQILAGQVELGHQAYENLVRCRDGSQRLLTWQIALLRDKSGRALGILSSGQDITEQRAAQDALQEERRRLENILWGTGTGTWEWNVQTGATRFNERWAQMVGYSLAELAPVSIATWEKFAHPDDLARSAEALQRHFAGDAEDYECETRMKHRNGRWIWVLDRGRIVSRDEEGQPLWMAGTHLEITERKETEMALRQSEEYHRSVVEVLAEGIVIQNIEGGIIRCNPSAQRILGLSGDDIHGRLLMDLGEKAVRADGSPYPPEQYPVRRCLRDGQPIYDEIVGIGQPSGDILWLSLNTQPVYDTKEQSDRASILAVVTSFIDITTQRQQQKQLEHLAHYDALTQLPNRVLLVDRLKQAMAQVKRRNEQLAAVYIDLDGFKEVNDRYGHDVGDVLLKMLADRLRGGLREADTVSRMGGDEFIAILSDLPDREAVLPLVERLLECCSLPFDIQGSQVQVSGSLGVTFYPQADPIEAAQLMAQADQAMYQAKQAGKNRYRLFAEAAG